MQDTPNKCGINLPFKLIAGDKSSTEKKNIYFDITN